MKNLELTGAELDMKVAEAYDLPCQNLAGTCIVKCQPFQPSTDWVKGGPIIEAQNIAVYPCADQWEAFVDDDSEFKYEACGPTPLIAAMRALVMWKFGSETDGQ